MAWYSIGTISLQNGSDVVTGVGTAFSTEIVAGDILFLYDEGVELLEVKRPSGNDKFLLQLPYSGATRSDIPYTIIRGANNARNFDLMQKIEEFLKDRQTHLEEFRAWSSGSADGGADGQYPLTDRFGEQVLSDSPAKLRARIDEAIELLQSTQDQVQKQADDLGDLTELVSGVESAAITAEAAIETARESSLADVTRLADESLAAVSSLASDSLAEIQDKVDTSTSALSSMTNESLANMQSKVDEAAQLRDEAAASKAAATASEVAAKRAEDEASAHRESAQLARAQAEALQGQVAADRQDVADNLATVTLEAASVEMARAEVEASRAVVVSRADEVAANALEVEASHSAIEGMQTEVATNRAAVESLRDQVQIAASQTAEDATAAAADRLAISSDKSEIEQHKAEIVQATSDTRGYRDDAERFKQEAESAAAAAAGGLMPVGSWDASVGTNPPDPEGGRAPWYRISAAGVVPGVASAINPTGAVEIGDNIYWSNEQNSWFHIDNTERFTSINGKTSGAVVLTTKDIDEEDGRLYFSEDRALSSKLSGFSARTTGFTISATDSVIDALEKAQGRLDRLGTAAEIDVATTVNDATPGRALIAGSGGLMGTAPWQSGYDFDALNQVSHVRTLTSLSPGTRPANDIPGFPDNAAVSITRRSSGDAMTQSAISFEGTYPRLALRHLRDASSGWLRWVEAWTTGNLTKTSSFTDTTAGALTTVGWYGLGAGAIPVSNFNSPFVGNGFIGTSVNDAENRPPAVAWAVGLQLSNHANPTESAQIVVGTSGDRGMHYRARYNMDGNTYYDWRKVWDSKDLVKTESSTDTTVGRMLQVGDGGLLGTSPGGNFDLTTGLGMVNRFFWAGSGTSEGLASVPTVDGILQSGHGIQVVRNASARTLMYFNNAQGAGKRLWIAGGSATALGPWYEVYTTFNTSSAVQDLLAAPDSASIRSMIGLGTVSSATDTTEGMLTTVGYQGLGTNSLPVENDLNNLLVTGFRLAPSSGLNKPISANGAALSVIGLPGWGQQLYFPYSPNSDVHRRVLVNGNFEVWKTFWDTGNLVKVKSAGDTTEGSVLTTGYAGLLRTTPITVVNNVRPLNERIEFALSLCAQNPADRPAWMNGDNANFANLTLPIASTRGLQLTFSPASIGGPNRVSIRTYTNSIFHDWVDLWTEANLVKVKSASDTTPGSIPTVGWMGLGGDTNAGGSHSTGGFDVITGLPTCFTRVFDRSVLDGTRHVLHMKDSENNGFDFACRSTLGQFHVRSIEKGIAGPFYEVWTEANLVKTKSNTDTTTGALTTVGWMGWGGSAVETVDSDLDNAGNFTCLFRPQDNANATNLPPGWSSSDYVHGFNTYWTSAVGAQLIFGRTKGVAFRQRNSTNSYGAWRTLWDTGNLSPATLDTAQTIAGVKTFSKPIIINTPAAAYDVDGTGGSGNSIPPGVAYHDSNNWTNSPGSTTTTVTVSASTGRQFQFGAGGNRFFGRSLHVSSNWNWVEFYTTGNTSSDVQSMLGAADAAGIRSVIGLSNVDNTADKDKPISTPQQIALNAKLDIGAGGIGKHLDLRNNRATTGTPADLYGAGTVHGFSSGGLLGISGLSSASYGSLVANGQWSDGSGGGGVNRLFQFGDRLYLQARLSDSAWGEWCEAWTSKNLKVASANTGNAVVQRDANGTIRVGVIYGSNIELSGTVKANSNITAYSDKRLKKNIKTVKDALNKVCSIRGVTFDRKDLNERGAGVIAQEIQKVLPEVVLEDEKGLLAVAYGNMAALYIEAIKELKAEVDTLKSQIATLQEAA